MSFFDWFTLNNYNFWSQVTCFSWCPNSDFTQQNCQPFYSCCCCDQSAFLVLERANSFCVCFLNKQSQDASQKELYLRKLECVLGSSRKTHVTGVRGCVCVKKNYLFDTVLVFTLQVIEKERVEKSQKLDELKRSGHILLDQMGRGKQLEGFSVL